jgi:hypothetical protein
MMAALPDGLASGLASGPANALAGRLSILAHRKSIAAQQSTGARAGALCEDGVGLREPPVASSQKPG